MYHFQRLLIALFCLSTLGGCAAVVVGGAATGAAVIQDRRSTGIIIDDKEILLKAVKLQHADEQLKQRSNIGVTTYNLQILLTGQAQSMEPVERYRQQLSRIQRVRHVFNEVAIDAEASWSEATEDAYLTSKVKLALFDVKMKGFNPLRVKVTTSQGKVYLMGLLTRPEADAVTEKVRYVSGVKRVVKLFEYVSH